MSFVLKRLTIKYFQSYTYAQVAFSPYVNVIMGPNMVGKSAMLRALRFIFYNKPEGKDFVQWGAKDAIVEIEYGDQVIKRVKGTCNIYEVGASVFSGFGKGVPQEVVEALGFSSVQVDRQTYELNFDHPHEAPFFICETDATKGKLFSKLGEDVLSGLVLLDKSIRDANAQLRSSTAERQVLVRQVANIEADLLAFSPLVDVTVAFDKCRKILDQIVKVEQEVAFLTECQSNLAVCVQDIDHLSAILDIGMVSIDTSIVQAVELSTEIYKLEELLSSYKLVNSQVALLEESIVVLEDIPKVALEEAVCLLAELNVLLGHQSSLQSVVEDMVVAETQQQQHQATLKSKLVAYKQLLLSAKKCPLCFRPVTGHDLKTILEELLDSD